MHTFFSYLILICLFSTGCWRTSDQTVPQERAHTAAPLLENDKNRGQLIHVHIIDFNGFSETITNKERLSQFEKRNFLEPQQYKKALRVFKRSSTGDSLSLVTAYHDNGQIHRYLECLNGRAFGNFREWYDNGQLKLEAVVISGHADLDDASIRTWTFDGPSYAWTEDGALDGSFLYKKGLLVGSAMLYYPSGKVEWQTEYVDGKKSGVEHHFREDGSILEEITYSEGLRDGIARGFWPNQSKQYEETFAKDLLEQGLYYEKNGSVASKVTDANGTRSLFGDAAIESQYEIVDGLPNGFVKIYSKDGLLVQEYAEIDGKKEGIELLYYPGTTTPKLSIEWKSGAITGIVETWYRSGVLESRREMKQNEKDGVSMGWYPDGALMLVEEYEQGKLRKGRYHRKRDDTPYSLVENGQGSATIFDSDGRIAEKITYRDGIPVL